MRRGAFTARSIALLAAASAAVHELRYLIGYGDHASRALAAHPHGYLSVALPGVITATLIAIGGMLMRLSGGRRSLPSRRRSLAVTWLACSLALALIYGTQETLEGAAAFAGSGWIGLALAVPAGLVVAVAMRGASAADELGAVAVPLRAVPIGSIALVADPTETTTRSATRVIRARGPPPAFVV